MVESFLVLERELDGESQIRIADVVAALSYALDLAEGQPEGHAVRSCFIGMHIARRLQLEAVDRAALFYALLSLTHYWLTPVSVETQIDLSPHALPKYAMYSVLRIAIAYLLSLGFTLVYGYIAAYNPRAEKFMVPLLDVLQSIPVLSVLPPVMVSMVTLFPDRQLGVELGSMMFAGAA